MHSDKMLSGLKELARVSLKHARTISSRLNFITIVIAWWRGGMIDILGRGGWIINIMRWGWRMMDIMGWGGGNDFTCRGSNSVGLMFVDSHLD